MSVSRYCEYEINAPVGALASPGVTHENRFAHSPKPGSPQMARRLAKSFDNATEFTLAVLSGKWKTTILCYLDERPRRYGELRGLISGLSDKVLTERLRDLRNLGLVTQRRSPRSPSGVYVLTRRGKMMQRVLRDLHAWGRQHSAVFGVKLTAPQKRSRSGLRSH